MLLDLVCDVVHELWMCLTHSNVLPVADRATKHYKVT